MEFQIYPPPLCLKAFVRYFWSFHSEGSGHAPLEIKTLVDDSSGILFNWGTGVTRNDLRLQPAVIYGQTTRPSLTHLAGGFATIGALFYPDAIHRLFNINAALLTNEIIALNEVVRFRDINQLFDAKTMSDRLHLFSHWLSCFTNAALKPDIHVQTVLDQIYQRSNNNNIFELYRNIAISPRHLERRFKQSVGVSPRHFNKVIRFKKAVDSLKRNKKGRLIDIAYDHDYFDQAHFIRHAKEMSGFTPAELSKRMNIGVVNIIF